MNFKAGYMNVKPPPQGIRLSFLREVGTHLCAGFFCCPKAGYNGMTGWMGYDFAKTSCVNRESETTHSGAGTEKRHLGKPAKKEEKMCP